MKAQFDSECPGCFGSIYEGDEILRRRDGDWVCRACAGAEVEEPAKPEGEDLLFLDPDVPTPAPVPARDSGQYIHELAPDAFMDPDEAAPELNVSGQPPVPMEERGKLKLGYVVKDPTLGDYRRYKNGKLKGITRMTTFNKAATDQNALSAWGKRNVLIGSVLRPDLVRDAAGLTHDDDKAELDRLVSALEEEAGSKVASSIGTLLHELTELLDAGHLLPKDIPEAYVDHLASYRTALAEAKLHPVPGLIERTVYLPYFGGVVGTFDRILWDETHQVYRMADLKTGKRLDYGWDEIEAQIAGYALAFNRYGVWDQNTREWDDSRDFSVATDYGVVMHLPVQGPTAGQCQLLKVDLESGWDYLQLCDQVRTRRARRNKPTAL